MKVFQFSNRFQSWVEVIMHSTRVSIILNSELNGYFSCLQSIRQGDPLSPLLFAIVENFHSRQLSMVVENFLSRQLFFL